MLVAKVTATYIFTQMKSIENMKGGLVSRYSLNSTCNVLRYIDWLRKYQQMSMEFEWNVTQSCEETKVDCEHINVQVIIITISTHF